MSAEDESRGPGRPRLVAGEPSVRLTTIVPLSLVMELDKAAKRRKVSRSDLVRLALAMALESEASR